MKFGTSYKSLQLKGFQEAAYVYKLDDKHLLSLWEIEIRQKSSFS